VPLSRHRSFVYALRLCAVLTCVLGAPTAQAGSLQTIDPMEAIRERLAAKLGAVPVPPSAPAGVLKVSTPPESASAASVADRSAAAGARRPTAAPTPGASPWAYEGAHGPGEWARLAPENATCASGQRQSPIDITDGIKVDLDAVHFDYKPSGFRVVDNGHTVQVNVAPGNTIEVLGRHYELVQFHFHRPSEERIDGKPFDMVVHLLHKSADGRLAMIAVLLERGSAQPVVQAVWNNLPLEKGDEVAAKTPIDVSALLPNDRRYYTYMGSLTTPPCSEGVLWMVMKAPVQISPEQLAIFTRLYPMNARPIQAQRGRLIKESN
jgi:carbonic anhydrase